MPIEARAALPGGGGVVWAARPGLSSNVSRAASAAVASRSSSALRRSAALHSCPEAM